MPERSMCEFVSLAGAYHASLEGIKTNFSPRGESFCRKQFGSVVAERSAGLLQSQVGQQRMSDKALSILAAKKRRASAALSQPK